MAWRSGLAVLLGGLFLHGQQLRGADAADAAAVQRWVAQLGSSRYAEREAASRLLDAHGAAALPALEAASRQGDAETRRRAEQLLAKIRQREQAAQLLAARRVRFVYNDTLVTEAVPDIAAKTGFPIQLDGDRLGLVNRRVTLDTGETTFWQALEQFCDTAGLSERPPANVTEHRVARVTTGRGGNVVLVEDAMNRNTAARSPETPLLLIDARRKSLPTHHAGAVRVRALPVAPRPEAVRTSAAPLLHLEVTPEPKLSWLGVVGLSIRQAVDDRDQQLYQAEPWVPEGFDPDTTSRNVILWDGATGQSILPSPTLRVLPIKLRGAAQPSTMLKEVSGTITAQVQSPQTFLKVDKILQAQEQTVKGEGGVSLTILDVRRESTGAVFVRLRLETPHPFGAAGMPQFVRVRPGFIAMRNRAASDNAPFALLDEHGKAVPRLSSRCSSTPQADGGLSLEYALTYQPATGQGAPAQLVYNMQRTVSIDIPFRLQNVPLP